MDISEQCNKSLEEQVDLFNSIKPLFTNKPILICLNKVDVLTVDDLPDEKKEIFKKFEEDGKLIGFQSRFEISKKNHCDGDIFELCSNISLSQ